MKHSAKYPTLPASLPKDLCLTWRNISYTVERKRNGGSFRAIFGLQHMEFVRLLNGGIFPSISLMQDLDRVEDNT